MLLIYTYAAGYTTENGTSSYSIITKFPTGKLKAKSGLIRDPKFRDSEEEYQSTLSRAELFAALIALSNLETNNCSVKLYTTSRTLRDGIKDQDNRSDDEIDLWDRLQYTINTRNLDVTLMVPINKNFLPVDLGKVYRKARSIAERRENYGNYENGNYRDIR